MVQSHFEFEILGLLLSGPYPFTCEAEEYENRGSASILFLRGNDRGHILLKSMYLLTYLFQKIKKRTSNTWMKPICTPSLAVIVLAFSWNMHMSLSNISSE